eukprot:scaffold4073_cov401-Prasinococcus_capsulatus_cf.AAC.3
MQVAIMTTGMHAPNPFQFEGGHLLTRSAWVVRRSPPGAHTYDLLPPPGPENEAMFEGKNVLILGAGNAGAYEKKLWSFRDRRCNPPLCGFSHNLVPRRCPHCLADALRGGSARHQLMYSHSSSERDCGLATSMLISIAVSAGHVDAFQLGAADSIETMPEAREKGFHNVIAFRECDIDGLSKICLYPKVRHAITGVASINAYLPACVRRVHDYRTNQSWPRTMSCSTSTLRRTLRPMANSAR